MSGPTERQIEAIREAAIKATLDSAGEIAKLADDIAIHGTAQWEVGPGGLKRIPPKTGGDPA